MNEGANNKDLREKLQIGQAIHGRALTMSFPKLFVMVDDDQDELAITSALFKRRFPTTAFLVEKKPERVVPLLLGKIHAGLAASSIVVLIDIRMPGLNGFELIYSIKNTIELYQCTIIMLSASKQQSDSEDAAEIGADGYIQKPFTVEKLEAALTAVGT